MEVLIANIQLSKKQGLYFSPTQRKVCLIELFYVAGGRHFVFTKLRRVVRWLKPQVAFKCHQISDPMVHHQSSPFNVCNCTPTRQHTHHWFYVCKNLLDARCCKPPTLNGVSDKTPRKFSDLLLSEPSDEQGNDSFEMLKFGLLAVVVDFRLSYRFYLPWFTRWSFFWYHQFTDRCT